MSASPQPGDSESSTNEKATDEKVYGSQFWLAYVANFALVAANSLMYRFAELVAFLGGSEQAAGAIVGTGFAAVLFVRLYLGQGIDRYGVRTAWVISSLLFIAGSASLLFCHKVAAGLYVARILYSIGMSGMLTCSVVHVQDLVPPHRRTEAIGILGTSGFLAMIAGTNLGDGIFAIFPLGYMRFAVLSGTVAALGVFYLACVSVFHARSRACPASELPLGNQTPDPLLARHRRGCRDHGRNGLQPDHCILDAVCDRAKHPGDSARSSPSTHWWPSLFACRGPAGPARSAAL